MQFDGERILGRYIMTDNQALYNGPARLIHNQFDPFS